MKRDILDELGQKTISPEEAQGIFDAVLDAGQMGLGEGVGMSRTEYTAHGHGVWFDELAGWRKNGWPDTCVVCGEKIDVPKFGWIAKELGPDQDHFLKHIECPTKARPRIRSAKQSQRTGPGSAR